MVFIIFRNFILFINLFFVQHVALTWDNILFSSSPDGEFVGRKTVEVGTFLDKSNKSRLGNTSRRLETGKKDMACTCPEGNILCLTSKMAEFKELCHPNQTKVYY